MRYIKISAIAVILTALTVGYLIIYPSVKENKENLRAGQYKIFSAKTMEKNGVTITAKPKFSEGKIAGFEIFFDAHSGSLNQDLVSSSVLLDDQGVEYKPSAWQGDGPGGHHRQGVLMFNNVKDLPNEMRLMIDDKPGNSAWTFFWP